MMTEQEVYLLFFGDDDGDWCKIDDVVTFCCTALCKDKCLLVDDASCLLHKVFKAKKRCPCGHHVVNDCNLFANKEINVVL